MTDYFRGKTLICEQTKPRTYFTPVFQRIGDRLKLHHMEVDCLGYRQPKKMLPIEHMGKHKQRIFELEDENAKFRELLSEIAKLVTNPYGGCLRPGCAHGCPHHLECDEELHTCFYVDRMRELGVEE